METGFYFDDTETVKKSNKIDEGVMCIFHHNEEGKVDGWIKLPVKEFIGTIKDRKDNNGEMHYLHNRVHDFWFNFSKSSFKIDDLKEISGYMELDNILTKFSMKPDMLETFLKNDKESVLEIQDVVYNNKFRYTEEVNRNIKIDNLEDKIREMSRDEDVDLSYPNYEAECSLKLFSLLEKLNTGAITEREFCNSVTPDMYVKNGLKSGEFNNSYDVKFGDYDSVSYDLKFEPLGNVLGIFRLTEKESWSFPYFEYDSDLYDSWQGSRKEVSYCALDGIKIAEKLESDYSVTDSVIRGKFYISAIDGEKVLDVLSSIKDDNMLMDKFGNDSLNSLTKYFVEVDKEHPFILKPEKSVTDDGFKSRIVSFAEVERQVDGVGEYVKMVGRTTQSFIEGKKGVITINFALKEENCKHLAKMLSSKVFKDKFHVVGSREFIQKHLKQNVKSIDHSDLFRKENKENTLKK